jgi:hypothetical protein
MVYIKATAFCAVCVKALHVANSLTEYLKQGAATTAELSPQQQPQMKVVE